MSEIRFINAAELDGRPVPQRTCWLAEPPRGRVKIRGEALSKPVYWTGTQWAVTAFGIETRDGTYAIAKDRLWEEEGEWGWFMHMSGKAWVDLRDFAHALAVARSQFRELFKAPLV